MNRIILAFLWLSALPLYAADNTPFTINGSGFGSNSANQVFLGGSAGPIESQADGTPIGNVGTSGILGSGWTIEGAATQNWEMISTARAWSATKSSMEDNNDGNQFQFGKVYDTGAQYTTTYVRFYVYIETALNNSTDNLQIKLVRHLGRIDCQDGLGDPDTANTYFTTFAGVNFTAFAINYNSGTCGSDNTLTPSVFSGNQLPYNKWLLVEYTIKFSTAPGVADAVYKTRITDVAANTVFQSYTQSSVLNWVATDVTRPYRYITMHGYIGNNAGTGPAYETKVYWDSNWYVETTPSGTTTPSWVLRCDNAAWVSVTKCAAQKWDTWSSTAIAIHRNYANVTGNAWYYVMTDINTPTSTTGIADSENGGGGGTVLYRKTLSPIGGKTGKRQVH